MAQPHIKLTRHDDVVIIEGRRSVGKTTVRAFHRTLQAPTKKELKDAIIKELGDWREKHGSQRRLTDANDR